jgi:hypothetical protein
MPLPTKTVLTDNQLAELLRKPDPETGRTPLAVMLDNMCWYDSQSERLLAQIEKLIVKADDPRSIEQAQCTLREFLVMRQKAQEAARDAAPYCHGRLATASPPSPTSDNDIHIITREIIDPISVEEAQRAYLQMIDGKKSPG